LRENLRFFVFLQVIYFILFILPVKRMQGEYFANGFAIFRAVHADGP
jgi:hypothetical protein